MIQWDSLPSITSMFFFFFLWNYTMGSNVSETKNLLFFCWRMLMSKIFCLQLNWDCNRKLVFIWVLLKWQQISFSGNQFMLEVFAWYVLQQSGSSLKNKTTEEKRTHTRLKNLKWFCLLVLYVALWLWNFQSWNWIESFFSLKAKI